jgi:large subunit ribosomal protein L20
MSRSTNAVPSRARRKRIISQAKGMVGRSKNCSKLALRAVENSMLYSYRDRKVRKRDFRKLWNVRINAGVRRLGYKYSTFISKLNASDINLNRKMLVDIMNSDIALFDSIVKKVML